MIHVMIGLMIKARNSAAERPVRGSRLLSSACPKTGRRITHPMRHRFIPPCRRRSILTRRRLLRIMLRFRITRQGFTTAVTEERPITSVPVQRFPLKQLDD